ncbi:peptidyl-tRNA hydrolase domain-containing protein [Trichoderma ceciliae]
MLLLSHLPKRAVLAATAIVPGQPVPLFRQPVRSKRYEAYDARLDQDALAEARSWYSSFDVSQLPKGSTTYTRSSGPGGQHVNKTETKAITVYPVQEIFAILPKYFHSAVRSSKYYTAGNDSLTFSAQTHRSRSANLDENKRKLIDEVMGIYREMTPAETSSEKKKKHQEVEKRFHEARVQDKKFISAKKQSRRGPPE